MSSGLILAIDPGMSKIGWAVVDKSGLAQGQGVIPFDGWDVQLRRLDCLDSVEVAVVGDGTNRVNIEQGLGRLVPEARIVSVDETASTVDAWQLKRREEAGNNPFLVLMFTLRQLFLQQPVDDYAARVIARRYLDRNTGAAKR